MGAHIILRIVDFAIYATLWACGVLLIIFGSIGVSNETATINMLNLISNVVYITTIFDVMPLFYGVAIFMIILGCFLFICGGVGVFGHIRRDRRLRFGYSASLACAILTEIALIIYAAVYPGTIQGWVQSQMYDTLYSFNSVVIIPSNGVIVPRVNATANAWENLQFQSHCCGSYGPNDFNDFNDLPWNRHFIISGGIVNATFPPSCCPIPNRYGYTPTNINEIPGFTNCITAATNTLPGCSNIVMSMAWNFNYISIIICSCLIAVEGLGLFFTLRLIKKIDD